MKRSFNESFGKPKRSRPENEDGPEIRFLIPSKAAGALIGKGGETVKRLRNDYQADISIPDSVTPERIMYVVAPTMDNIYDVALEVLHKIEEVSKGTSKEPEVKILIHQSQAGAVIGRAGGKIKELRESTGTAIKVFGECAPGSTDRVVVIAGEESKVITAIREIMAVVNEVPIKGAIRNYDTSNYQPDFVEEYGGYQSDRPFMKAPGGPPGGFGGRAPPAIPSGFARSSGYGPPPGRMPAIIGGGNSFEEFLIARGMGPFRAGGPRSLMDLEDDLQETVQQVTIPKDLAGSIIGKGGDRITRIRDESGAKIVVREPDGESIERVITITGTPLRIQYAQFLLQQCVRASAAGRRYIYEANR